MGPRARRPKLAVITSQPADLGSTTEQMTGSGEWLGVADDTREQRQYW
jgi:hypothetical protein